MANKLDLAVAQFVGFRHGRWNRDDIVGLINSMGLTKIEWMKLKQNHEIEGLMSEDEANEIEEYFTKKSNY